MAGTDYNLFLAPGATEHQNIAGEFIYCKSVDRPIYVTVDGQTVKMEAGDQYRPGGRFRDFEITNPNRDADVYVVLVVGRGSYSRQIIHGQVEAETVLRAQDGRTYPDTRRTLALTLQPLDLAQPEYEQGDVIKDFETPVFSNGDKFGPDTTVFIGPNDRLCAFSQKDSFSGLTESRIAEFSGSGSVERYHTSSNALDEDYANVWFNPDVGDFEAADNSGDYQTVTFRRYENGNWNVIGNYVSETNDTEPTACYDPASGLYLVAQGGSIYALDPENFEKVGQSVSIDFPASNGILTVNPLIGAMVAAADDVITVFRVDTQAGTVNKLENWPVNYPEEFEDYQQGVKGGAASNNANSFIYQEWANHGFGDRLSHASIRQVSKQQFKQAPLVLAQSSGGIETILYKTPRIPRITAQLSAEMVGGSVELSGEVIRAALEWYYGRAVANDYMDHVYRVELPAVGNGIPQPAIVSGTRSLARAGIEDDFTIGMPGTVTLELDARLQLNEEL